MGSLLFRKRRTISYKKEDTCKNSSPERALYTTCLDHSNSYIQFRTPPEFPRILQPLHTPYIHDIRGDKLSPLFRVTLHWCSNISYTFREYFTSSQPLAKAACCRDRTDLYGHWWRSRLCWLYCYSRWQGFLIQHCLSSEYSTVRFSICSCCSLPDPRHGWLSLGATDRL